MSNHTFASAEASATALNMLALAGYENIDNARADNIAFVCTDCGSTVAVTPTATSSREDQRDSLIEYFPIECCEPENFFLV